MKKRKKAKRYTVFLTKEQIGRQTLLFKNSLETPFVFIRSNSRTYLDAPEFGYFMTSDDKMNMSEVGYIKQVKDHIIKEKLYEGIPKINPDTIKYFHYNQDLFPGDKFSDCYEIDLNSAYWETANELNLLKPEIYNLAYKKNPKTGNPFISKLTRLACIGSLARKRRIYTFDGESVTMKRERSPLTRHIWDYICSLVANTMIQTSKAAGDEFIFFWVDAIFVKSKAGLPPVTKALDKAGYKYKIKKIKRIEAYRDGIKKMIRITDYDKNEEPREFPYSLGGSKSKSLLKRILKEIK